MPGLSKTYFTILHYISVFNLPVAILSIYIIIRASPTAMHGVYRRLLLFHAVVVACSDLCMTLLTCPVLLAPVIGFYMGGLLDQIGVSTLVQFSITMSFIMVSAVTVDLLFHVRFDSILPSHSKMKLSPFFQLALYRFSIFFFSTVPSIVLYFIFPNNLEYEQYHYKVRLSKKYHEIKQELLDPRTVAIAITDSTYANIVYLITIVALIFVLGLVGFFIFHSFRTLLSATCFMSPSTKKQSLHFLVALIFQSAVHFVLLVLPLVVVCVFQMRFDYMNRVLTNAAVCIFSVHGSCGLITMLLVTRPYRQHLLFIISKVIPFSIHKRSNLLPVLPSQSVFSVTTTTVK